MNIHFGLNWRFSTNANAKNHTKILHEWGRRRIEDFFQLCPDLSQALSEDILDIKPVLR
jgi:hypothetical protein